MSDTNTTDFELSITSSSSSDHTVTENLFGGNILHSSNTNDGRPDDEFIFAQSELGIGSLRYPAGQADQVYREGILENGQLPGHVVDFMNWAVESNTQVVIVTPTHPPVFDPAEIEVFVRLLMEHYPDQIEAFEVGNEFWMSMGETEYGEMADASIGAISSGIGEAESPEIWVQMANASGAFTDFDREHGSWRSRIEDSNNAIIAELSDASRNAIDGVVDHYYFRSQSTTSTDQNDVTNYIGVEHDLWESNFGRDLTLNITEWNIKSSNETQLGITAASTIIAQFQYMLELEVDTAYVWPPQHNMPNDLAGSMNAIIDAESGIVINTVIGAMFDILSSTLVGLNSLNLEIESNVEDIVTYGFGDSETYVIYLTSRSEEVTDFNFNLDFWEGMELTSALQVGYDEESSDGVYYSPRDRGWAEADFVYVDGEEYYLNEHDVMAEITDLGTSFFGSDINLTLNPFEVVELTFFDNRGDNYLLGGSEADQFSGGVGDDTIIGEEGDDRLFGDGGRDSLEGGNGNDLLSGGLWHDTLSGGEGDDTVYGGRGDDIIQPGSGSGSVFGGLGNDVLSFSDVNVGVSVWGFDQIVEVGFAESSFALLEYLEVEEIEGTHFNDTFEIAHDRMTFRGLDGNDVFNIFRGDHVHVEMGSGDDDVFVFGQSQADIYGGSGDDRFFTNFGGSRLSGQEGDDEFYLFGADGNTVEFGLGDGQDTIHNFNLTHDKLTFLNVTQNDLNIIEDQFGTRFILSDDSSIILNNVYLSDEFDFLSFG